jgi:hypothetical protein
MNKTAPSQSHSQSTLPIFIDEVKYDAPAHTMTGQALRELPAPPVPGDRDLWLDVPGPKDDILIRPDQTYDVKPGSHYFTAPSTINPGGPSHAIA